MTVPALPAAALAASTADVTKRRLAGYTNAVYFVNWGVYSRQYHAYNLPGPQLTNVLYAFMNVRDSGEVYTTDAYSDTQLHYPGDSWNDVGNNAYGSVKQLFLQKKANRRLKVMLSIGGWTYSQNPNFASAASTDATRKLFAKSSVAIMKDYGFDGIDVDWEYPKTATEAANFVLLLQAVRAELDAYANAHAPGYRFLLTMASPAGKPQYGVLDLKGIADAVDAVNLMAYDYAGSWDAVSGHQANLHPSRDNPRSTPFSTAAAVRDYLAAGVPAAKLVLGMPLYGRSFQRTAGPGQPFEGVGSGSHEAGVWDYKALPRAGAGVVYDARVVASYSYDAAARELVSYDTPDAVRDKVRYALDNGLGGSMFWEASGDRTDGESLIAASYAALGGPGGVDRSENLLRYPDSQYDNIRSGMA
ncbi:Endochitinase 42 [Colletotrichum trifolii]|uniref:chitinase n=1 Tax=Colletotrichum trifolii TaxID=5466 RepID=A0A4R8RPC1_COLTR|nr:Endochitinase 42 [Colletotrichum trifolii]